MPEAVIVSAARTAIGTARKGTLIDVSSFDLAQYAMGEALKRYPGLLPKPLDTALSQIWGYASNEARHVQEGRETSREEAELLVGLAAALSTYLTRKKS